MSKKYSYVSGKEWPSELVDTRSWWQEDHPAWKPWLVATRNKVRLKHLWEVFRDQWEFDHGCEKIVDDIPLSVQKVRK